MNVQIREQRVFDHYNWLEKKLKKNSKDNSVAWLGVVIHHPVLRDASLKKDLLPLLQKYKVDFSLVGHKHQFEYANFGYDEKVRFPSKNRGPILDDCKGKKEILNTKSREQIFNKGEKFHQFMVGGSGRKLREVCPYKDQDGKVYFQNVENYGLASMEVDSHHFTVKYHIEKSEDLYTITVNK